MKIPNIVKAIEETYEGQGASFTAASNYASMLGYYTPELDGCLRRGVYARTKGNEAEPWSLESLMRFKEGKNQEKQILRDISDTDIEIMEQQVSLELKEYQIRMKLDGVILIPGEKSYPPLEIKSCAPSVFQIIHCFEDLLKKPWLRAYMIQINLYMLTKGCEYGVLLFKDKSSGAHKQINCKLDFELTEFAIRAAEQINQHMADCTLPDRIKDIDTCAKCPFKLVCLPDIKFGEEIQIGDDPDFANKVDKWYNMKPDRDEWQKLDKIVKTRVKATAQHGVLRMLIGKYLILGKTTQNGSFRTTIERNG